MPLAAYSQSFSLRHGISFGILPQLCETMSLSHLTIIGAQARVSFRTCCPIDSWSSLLNFTPTLKLQNLKAFLHQKPLFSFSPFQSNLVCAWSLYSMSMRLSLKCFCCKIWKLFGNNLLKLSWVVLISFSACKWQPNLIWSNVLSA